LQKARNQFSAARVGYHQALIIYRRLAETCPGRWLPAVGVTLNNLANLEKARNEFSIAEEKYQETLVIYRKLAEKNPQTWLADVAVTLKGKERLHCRGGRVSGGTDDLSAVSREKPRGLATGYSNDSEQSGAIATCQERIF
jgi:tetratricopeptide (TPR) repeat protein